MEMKLTRNEIRILREIASSIGKRIGDIGSSLDISYPSLSRTLRQLTEKGLIETRKEGLSKHVFFSETKHSILLRSLLTEFEHIRFENILSGSSMEILYYLSKSPLSKIEIVGRTGLSEKTIKTKLRVLREYGIVISQRGSYRLNERFNILRDFLIEFKRYLNMKAAQEFSEDAIILWQDADEFLLKTSERKESSNFFLTSITAFPRYGVQLFLPERYYYFHSKRRKKLDPEDIILHALLLDPTDTRVILVVLLLLKKHRVDVDYLTNESNKYPLRTTVKDLIEYIRTKGEVRPNHFPNWGEYEAKASEYGL